MFQLGSIQLSFALECTLFKLQAKINTVDIFVETNASFQEYANTVYQLWDGQYENWTKRNETHLYSKRKSE